LGSTPQPGGPRPCIYIPQEQGGPVIPPGTGFPFRRLLRLAELRWRCSKQPPRGDFFIQVSRIIFCICPTHLIPLGLITIIIFGEEYKFWRSVFNEGDPFSHPYKTTG
jgi:hypothetical protein